MKKSLTLFASAAALLGVPALAAPGDKAKADGNGDGITTRAEVQANAAAMFTRMDANKDGKVDQADMAQRMATRHAERFARLDTDNNGAISRAEWEAGAKAMHDRRMERRGDHGGEGRGGDGHGWRDGKRGEGKHHGMRGGPRQFVGGTVDANKDGGVTQAEFEAAALARFERADANKDGQVTAAERQAAREARRAEWQAKRAAAPAPAPKAQ